MGAAKRYTIYIGTTPLYTGPFGSAQLVFSSVHKAFVYAGLNPAEFPLLMTLDYKGS